MGYHHRSRNWMRGGMCGFVCAYCHVGGGEIVGCDAMKKHVLHLTTSDHPKDFFMMPMDIGLPLRPRTLGKLIFNHEGRLFLINIPSEESVIKVPVEIGPGQEMNFQIRTYE